MKSINDMTQEELDVAVAREVLGWTDLRVSSGGFWSRGINYCNIGKFSTDISDAFAAEAEIERRELHLNYVKDLLLATGAAMHSNPSIVWWKIAHASPADRCRAILQTVRSVKP